MSLKATWGEKQGFRSLRLIPHGVEAIMNAIIKDKVELCSRGTLQLVGE